MTRGPDEAGRCPAEGVGGPGSGASQPASPAATENISGQEENLSPFPSADAARERSSTESMQRADAPQAQTEGVNSSVNEAAAQSENPAVRQFAEVAASDSLTGKTIGLFTPNARTGKTVRPLSKLTA